MFLILRGEIEGRLDVYYNFIKKKKPLNFKYKTKSLISLVRTFSGGTPDKSNPNFWGGDISWVSPKDMKGFELYDSEDTITEEGLNYSSSKLVDINSLLIVVRSGILQHTLPVLINKNKVAINQDIKALVLKTEEVEPYYLAHFLRTFQDNILPLVVKHSTTVQSVNTFEFDNLKIPIPPLSIQHQIIAKFSAAYTLQKDKEAEAKRLLSTIDDYLLDALGIVLPNTDNFTNVFYKRQSEVVKGRLDPFYHLNSFNFYKNPNSKYKSIKLREVCESVQTGLAIRSDFRIDNGKFPYFGANGIIGHMEDFTHEGKYLIVAQDGYIGNHYVFEGKFWASNHNWVVKFKEEIIDYDFAKYILDFWNYSYLITGGVIPKLTKESFLSIKIPLPPLSIQQSIAAHIRHLRTRAKDLEDSAKTIVETAKKEVEAMILND